MELAVNIFFKVVIIPLIGWIGWISIKVFNNEKEISNNNTRDQATEKFILKFEKKIDLLIANVHQVQIDLAILKAEKNG